MQNTARLLHVEFKVDLEYAQRELKQVQGAIKRWALPCMHGKRSVAFVVITNETDAELVQRLRPALDDVTANYRVHEAPKVVVARHGSIDTLVTRVGQAWDEIRKRRNPDHMRQRQASRSERPIYNRERGAIRQVSVEPLGVRQKPKEPDGK